MSSRPCLLACGWSVGALGMSAEDRFIIQVHTRLYIIGCNSPFVVRHLQLISSAITNLSNMHSSSTNSSAGCCDKQSSRVRLHSPGRHALCHMPQKELPIELLGVTLVAVLRHLTSPPTLTAGRSDICWCVSQFRTVNITAHWLWNIDLD